MKKQKRADSFRVDYERRTVGADKIEPQLPFDTFDKRALRARAAHFLLNGVPEFSVNEQEDGAYRLLAADGDYYAAKSVGTKEFAVRVYRFTGENEEAFSCIENLKTNTLSTIEEGYLMRRLVEFGLTQDDIASLIGRSRPAVANTLRLLTLSPEVIGLIESGQLSAGHARTLVRVPSSQQLAFAQECIKREYSVREMEGAVKAFLTPDGDEEAQRQARSAAKNAEIKALVQRMRSVFKTKVSLIGNEKKGRIYIDYYSTEDLYRFEEYLDMIESFSRD
ncbi:MAG: ParB/RepB/Spo0J family partition protein [Clostridia bacterium]|nr:ParB/RepB/Spo0J family partition protein [Clostridia bacterium]